MKQITLNVEGMSCGHCVKAIENSVGELAGVAEVKVHLQEGKVDVRFDTVKVDENIIKETIEEQGYDLV